MKRSNMLFAALVLASAFTQSASAQTTAAITATDLRKRIATLADDSTEGRDTGRRGGVRAANYIAAELKRLGLEPAGDNGSYLQRIPWLKRTPDSTSVLNVGGEALKWSQDFVLMPRLGFALALGGQPFGADFTGENVATVYGGRIGGQLIDPAAARGKVVVFKPAATGNPVTFWAVNNLRQYSEARAIVVGSLGPGFPAGYKNPRETYWDAATVAGMKPMAVIAVTNAVIGKIFGADSVAVGQSGGAISGTARFVDSPTEAPAYNVVGILRGRDPKLRATYVAVGSHYDHVGMGPAVDHDSLRVFNMVVRPRGADDPPPRAVTAEQWQRIHVMIDSMRKIRPARRDSIFNGADDDASGTAIALEMAEMYASPSTRPARSLLFVFHTAEEKGLFGAQYFTDHPTAPLDSVIAQVNMDQMGRGQESDNPPGGPDALVLIGAKRRSSELGTLAESLNAKLPKPFHFDYGFDRDGDETQAYCRSDHYMYARYGMPVIFFSAAAWHIDYHMVSDEPQYIAYDRTASIGNYIARYVGTLGNLTHRPVLDGPKPADPNALCKQ